MRGRTFKYAESKSGRLLAVLSRGKIMITLKSVHDDFMSRNKISFDSFGEEQNWWNTNSFVFINNASQHLFKRKRIHKLLECLEDYLNYIGWEKIVEDGLADLEEMGIDFDNYDIDEVIRNITQDNDEFIRLVLIFKTQKELSLLDKILKSNRDLKDKWCGFVSSLTLFKEINSLFYSDEVMSTYKNSQPLNNISSNRMEFESCYTYLTRLFPFAPSYDFIETYHMSGFDWIQIDDHSYIFNLMKDAVSIVNADDKTLVRDVDKELNNDFLYSHNQKTVIVIFNYISFMELDHKIPQNMINDLTVEQFIELFFSIELSLSRRDNAIPFEVFDFQYNRVINGEKFNNMRIYNDEVFYSHVFRPRHKNKYMKFMMTVDEHEKFYKLDYSNLFKAIEEHFFFFKEFINNPDVFLELNKEIMTNDWFAKESISADSNPFIIIFEQDKGRRVFESYMKDQSIPLEMLLDIEEVSYIPELKNMSLSDRDRLSQEQIQILMNIE